MTEEKFGILDIDKSGFVEENEFTTAELELSADKGVMEEGLKTLEETKTE